MHKAVPNWNLDYMRTPLLAIAKGPRHDLKNTIDMIRLFADRIDLTDENNDIWPMISALSPISITGGEPFVLLWLLRSFGSNIKPRFHQHEFALILDDWMRSEEQKVSELLTNLGSCQINAVCHPRGYSILHRTLARSKDPLLYLQKGADPHLVGREVDYSPHWESPTSLAMFHSEMFHTWRMALISSNINLKEFVQQEIHQRRSPLQQAGWNTDTLLALFNYCDHASSGDSIRNLVGDSQAEEFSPTLASRVDDVCSECLADYGRISIEPKWLQRIERIKLRLYSKSTSAPFNLHEGFQIVATDETYDKTPNPTFADGFSTELEAASSDNETMDSDDENDPQEGPHDQTSPKKVNILDLHFQDDRNLCMQCWENYKNLGYNSASHDYNATHYSLTDDDLQSNAATDDDSSTDQDYSPFLIHT